MITLSMIVKNEEKHLANCLESVKDVVDEIILVDTGSSDSTIDIAKNIPQKYFILNGVTIFPQHAILHFGKQQVTGFYILTLMNVSPANLLMN